MYNPLFIDPATLKDAEIENRIIELSKKYQIAAKFGQGTACDQIIIFLNLLKEEQKKRHYNLMTKTANNQNKDLGNLINVT
jgi:hypothetical protein